MLDSTPDPVAADGQPIDLTDHSLYLNRELSLLEFQRRVLEEAQSPGNPLLERVKFLAIMSSNLAEFFMVRIGGLKQQVAAGVNELSADGRTPAEQLEDARDVAVALIHEGRRTYQALCEELREHNIVLAGYHELDAAQKKVADEYFATNVFPVLTPLAFDPGRPFPHISNLSLNLAVVVRGADGEERFARIKIPKGISRLVAVPSPGGEPAGRRNGHWFVWLEQLVIEHLDSLFTGVDVLEAHAFRITRDAEVAIQEIEADDLLETIEEGIRKRRFGSVVRVTVDSDTPESVRAILTDNLRLGPGELVVVDPPLGFSDLFQLAAIDRPELKFPPFVPALPRGLEDLEEADLFGAIRERDLLIHRPFESFEPVVALLRQAADDPDVLAIKMTLYRVGKNSPIVEALLEAAENGKEVAVLVELKARFDEESNIGWARQLEAAGVHVVYGIVGFKVHSKVALIVRREGRRIRRYLHVGTGNYNTATATQYTDLDMLTCDDVMAADASRLFNSLTGYAVEESYERFLVAPVSIRSGLEERIRREMAHARDGRPARLIFKVNAIADRRMTALLYEASQAGVQIDLLVRGVCILRPGVPGVSDNIRVTSLVGRFLEHARLYWFANDGDSEVFIGSADLMNRNISRRVEVLAPVRDRSMAERLRYEVLEAYLSDTTNTRELLHDGTYRHLEPAAGEEPFNAQHVLIELAGGSRADEGSRS